MSKFKFINRISESVYANIDSAKAGITGLTDGVDGEIVIARYTSGSDTKCILGVCYKNGNNPCKWTIMEDTSKLEVNYEESSKTLNFIF